MQTQIPNRRVTVKQQHTSFSIGLIRAFGPGFGSGELLVRRRIRDNSVPFEMEACFLPDVPVADIRDFTEPDEWLRVNKVPIVDGSEYFIIEVANSQAELPRFRILFCNRTPMTSWMDLNSDNLQIRMTDEQSAMLFIFTDVVLRLRSGPTRIVESRLDVTYHRHAAFGIQISTEACKEIKQKLHLNGRR